MVTTLLRTVNLSGFTSNHQSRRALDQSVAQRHAKVLHAKPHQYGDSWRTGHVMDVASFTEGFQQAQRQKQGVRLYVKVIGAEPRIKALFNY